MIFNLYYDLYYLNYSFVFPGVAVSVVLRFGVKREVAARWMATVGLLYFGARETCSSLASDLVESKCLRGVRGSQEHLPSIEEQVQASASKRLSGRH